MNARPSGDHWRKLKRLRLGLNSRVWPVSRARIIRTLKEPPAMLRKELYARKRPSGDQSDCRLSPMICGEGAVLDTAPASAFKSIGAMRISLLPGFIPK